MRRPKLLARCVGKIRGRPRTTGVIVGVLVLGAAAAAWFTLHPRGVQPLAAPVTVASGSSRVLVAVAPAPRPTRVVAFTDGCVTAECHAKMTGASVTHAPVTKSACNTCHAPDKGGHVYPLVTSKQTVCSSCHDTGEHHLFQHKAMGDDACLACHDPHTSRTRALLIGETTDKTCTRCHPHTEGAVQHPPYAADRCDSCHDPHGAENQGLLLGGKGADHCRMCHSPIVRAMETGSHTHRDAEGSCLACHAPHAADHKGLLVAQPRDICVTCHADVGKTVAGAVVSHDPLMKGDQCVTCHEPHASEHPKMLRETQAQVCLSCHDKPVTAADGRQIAALAQTLATAPVVHGAVRAGDCSACHSVHGSLHAKLLREVNPQVLAGPFDVRNYALCFSCHDKNLAAGKSSTQFRDGDRNLHEVHLRPGDKTRGCATCHEVHSGSLPRLIAKNVNYEGSGWVTPMGFVLTEDGGSCGPGCHEPLSYSRRPGGARAPNNGGAP